ncbi:MAG: YopX family protein, partial [Ruminococcus sp.]|nr:YopX family protein [Ruminococcus sp.]
MRTEVLFRGRTEDGKWFYGDLFRYSNTKISIFYNTENGESDNVYVIPETVGVFTGYRALNYERIFEGDILKTMTGHFLLVTDSGYGDW